MSHMTGGMGGGGTDTQRKGSDRKLNANVFEIEGQRPF